jgi:uncharacterized RDD family membrane protein YckC
MEYAGFLRRLLAFILDSIVLGILSGIVGFILGLGLGLVMGGGEAVANLAALLGFALGVILQWIYFAAMESSDAQATIGKMALGIKVSDLDGNPVSFARATGRHFGKYLSGIILLIGYLMVPFTAKKQALHDMLAGCLVIRK